MKCFYFKTEICIFRVHELRKGYFASVSHVDHEIGRVLDWLKESDLPRNTITVLTSDHGFLLGEHGTWKKEMLYDLATQVPLMIRVPGETDEGLLGEILILRPKSFQCKNV